MSDYLTEDWPLGPTSTVYMDGTSLYAVRRWGRPGVLKQVKLRADDAEAVREAAALTCESEGKPLVQCIQDVEAVRPGSEDSPVSEGFYEGLHFAYDWLRSVLIEHGVSVSEREGYDA